jgi:hypothetical protein
VPGEGRLQQGAFVEQGTFVELLEDDLKVAVTKNCADKFKN